MEVRWKCPGCGAENIGSAEDDLAACTDCHDTFFWESVAWVPVHRDRPPTEEVTP